PIPVSVVDSGTVSFGIACCVWEAAEALRAGATVADAAGVAERVGATVGNVFVVKALDLARAGGRLSGTDSGGDPNLIRVMTLTGDKMEVIGSVASTQQAADTMAAHVRAAGTSLRAGIGAADRATETLTEALHKRLAHVPEVRDVVRYRVGPSVGAHTGPGTAGVMYYESL
nr:DegV family protein [Actinomycetota bacterium]